MTMAYLRRYPTRLPSLTRRPIPSDPRIACFSSTSALDSSRASRQASDIKGPAATADEPPSLSPQWLSELRTRVGRCITFGVSAAQAREAGSILQHVARDWRSLVAGREGYLTRGSGEGGGDSAGLFRHGVVWGEMDVMSHFHFSSARLRLNAHLTPGHVNNVMYNRYAESARVNWVRHYGDVIDPVHRKEWHQLVSSKGIGLILRSIRTDFKFPMRFPDRVTVYHKLATAPLAITTTSSTSTTPPVDHFILDVLMLSELHRRPVARCTEDIVVYDYLQEKKTGLHPFMVSAFATTFERQQEEAKVWDGRVKGLMERVRELEKGSWDREGAVEDVGGPD